MERIIYIILLVLYGVVMLMMCFLQYYTTFLKKNEKPKNKVHFYVAKDVDSATYLYLSKPKRYGKHFVAPNNCKYIAAEEELKNFNLEVEDFKDLSWEDGPVEVFLNLED